MRTLPALLLSMALACGGGEEPATPPPATNHPTPAPAGGASLTARVVEGQCHGLGVGTSAQAGATLETAPTERARLELSDGSTMILDRESKVVLETAGRRVRLERGAAVLDVASNAGAPPFTVKLGTSDGEVRVTGTKLAIRSDGGRSLIDVSRGEVRLACPKGEEVVRAGEQGVMAPGEAPKVEPAPDLAGAIGWSQKSATDPEAGIGSLRARRPGVTTGAEQELRLAEHAVRVRISGPIARTEIEQSFANDGAFELEGTYRFPLPAGARIAGMALEVDGAWREGRFVDRNVGERIWRGVQKNARLGGGLGRVDNDDILFAPGPWRDPALLAWEAGNRFSIRIFPIRPHSVRKVRLAYVETLPRTTSGERRYVYPLPQGQWASLGRSVTDRLTVEVRVAGPEGAGPKVEGLTLTQRREDGALVLAGDAARFVPTGNLVVRTPDPAGAGVSTASYRDGASLYGVVALRPELPRTGSSRGLEHVLALDSSYGSTGEIWRREIAFAEAFVRELGADDRVTVLACDVGCKAVGAPAQIPSAALGTALSDALGRIEPGGTTDLVRTIEEAARVAGDARPERGRSILYVGDGVATVGVRDAGRIAELAARAATSARAIVSTVAVGTTSDTRTLAALATRGGGVALAHEPNDDPGELALRLLGRLRAPALENARIELPAGATEIAPAALGSLRAGQEVWVGALLTGATRGDLVLRGTLDGRPFETRTPISFDDVSTAGNAFVPAMWAERRVEDLSAAGDQNREIVVELATRFGLVTPFTSLLVLDSDALAERLGIRESGPHVEWSGDEDVSITETPAQQQGIGSIPATSRPSSPAAPREEGEARRGGGGNGHVDSLSEGGTGEAGGVAAMQPPQLRGRIAPGSPQVNGDMDPQVVRRVVLTNLGRFRACYERAIRVNPTLQGGLVLQFQIAPDGHVASAAVASSTLASPDVENCMQAMAQRLSFPPTEGGPVAVRFPLRMLVENEQAPSPGWRGNLTLTPRRVAVVQPVRAGTSRGLEGASQAELRQVAELRAKLAAEPDRRKHHRELVRLLARLGAVDEGVAAVRSWLGRDAMDAEALTLLADFLARQGDRDRAVRTLASVVEIQPGDKAAHERMSLLYERAGRLDDACPHRVTLAALSPSSNDAAAAATRCETTGEAPAPDDVRGDLVVTATFDAGVDLELALVMRDGTRVSWMGGKRNVRAAGAASLTTEKLSLGFLPIGVHTIEVTRSSATAGPPVSGTLEIRALGESRRVPFRLEGVRIPAASINVGLSGGSGGA